MKVAIIGGGPSGLYLSILLKRRQPEWSVDVVEQNSADATFGFGVVLADSGLNRIQAAEPEVYERLIAKMSFNGVQTIKVQEQSIDLHHPAKGGAIARIDLLHVLQDIAERSGVAIRYGQRVDHPDDLAALGLGDADIVVGADGANSVVRAAYEQEFGTTRSSLTNHFAWYGTPRVFVKTALVFRDFEGGSFIAHYYPYCATGSTFVAECDHATWQRFSMEAMTNDQRQALFERVFAPELDGAPLVSNNSNWRQFPVVQTRQWAHGRHVLIGDAQTIAHFSIGSGTRIAMEDAIALAKALTDPANPGQPQPTPQQRLQQFAAHHGPEKAKLLTASRKSYLWYEHIGDWMRRYPPLAFVHAFMTRTGRMSEARLAQAYPELVVQWRQAGLLSPSAAEPASAKLAQPS